MSLKACTFCSQWNYTYHIIFRKGNFPSYWCDVYYNMQDPDDPDWFLSTDQHWAFTQFKALSCNAYFRFQPLNDWIQCRFHLLLFPHTQECLSFLCKLRIRQTCGCYCNPTNGGRVLGKRSVIAVCCVGCIS